MEPRKEITRFSKSNKLISFLNYFKDNYIGNVNIFTYIRYVGNIYDMSTENTC